jgi:hypothetical protein
VEASSHHPRDLLRFEAQIGQLAFARTQPAGVVKAANFQRFIARLATTAMPSMRMLRAVGGGTGQSVFVLQVHQHQAPCRRWAWS